MTIFHIPFAFHLMFSNLFHSITVAISAASIVWVTTTALGLWFQNTIKSYPKLVVFVAAYGFCALCIVLTMVYSYGICTYIVTKHCTFAENYIYNSLLLGCDPCLDNISHHSLCTGFSSKPAIQSSCDITGLRKPAGRSLVGGIVIAIPSCFFVVISLPTPICNIYFLVHCVDEGIGVAIVAVISYN